MKFFLIFFCLVLFSSCTVYTVTNKTDRDFEIKKAGEEQISLKARKCIELTEYFLGLAGDFPFVIEGEEQERNPGHYEIEYKVQAETKSEESAVATPVVSVPQKPYIVSLSEKNPECDDEDKDKDKESNTKEGETKLWPKDTAKNVFCLSGQPKCSEGVLACLLMENNVSQPACVRGQEKEGKWEKVAKAVLSCAGAKEADQNKKPLCLPPVLVNVNTNQPALCGGAAVECTRGGRAVCGKVPGDLQNKAYCVNATNILYGDVTCANGVTPSCSGTSI